MGGPGGRRRRRGSSRSAIIRDSDKLCLARIQHGSGEAELVVGVRNMAAGDLVPWAPPGARVPVLDEPLGRREIRGVVSEGMLCSPRELAIGGDHEGILLLNDDGLERRGPISRRALGAGPRRCSTSRWSRTGPTSCRCSAWRGRSPPRPGVPLREPEVVGDRDRRGGRGGRRPCGSRRPTHVRGTWRGSSAGWTHRPVAVARPGAPRRPRACVRSTRSSTRRTTRCSSSGSRCTGSTSRVSRAPAIVVRRAADGEQLAHPRRRRSARSPTPTC